MASWIKRWSGIQNVRLSERSFGPAARLPNTRPAPNIKRAISTIKAALTDPGLRRRTITRLIGVRTRPRAAMTRAGKNDFLAPIDSSSHGFGQPVPLDVLEALALG